MMLNLEKRSQAKVKVDVTDDNGQVIVRKLINIYSERDIEWLRKLNPLWSVADCNTILGELTEEESNGQSQPMVCYDDFQPPADLIESVKQVETVGDSEQASTSEQIEFVIHIRELNQQKRYSIPYKDVEPSTVLKDVLLNPPNGLSEPLLEWTDRERLCCLDVDYHTTEMGIRPNYDELAALVSKLKPSPYCWHPTHGKGAKLYYVFTPGFTATELAAVAGLAWVQMDPRATFDLSKVSRHPSYKRTRDNANPPCPKKKSESDPFGMGTPTRINFGSTSTDLSSLRRYLNSELDENDISEFLQSKGWTMGQTLPHSECPIDPGNSSDETKENVYVGESGLFCHRCSGRGLGVNGSGYAPYAALIGSNTDNRLRLMVRNFCHLEHARIILENIYPNVPVKTLEIIYRVLLKIVHQSDDPRIWMALTCGKGFIRTNGTWVSVDGQHVLSDGIQRWVQSLPATLIPKEDSFAVNIPVATAFLNGVNLEEYGYPDVTFIRGCKIYGQHLPYKEGEIVKTVIHRDFRNHVPRYIHPSQRMPSEHAWGLIESEFPGIDRNYIRLLIAAKGASEGRLAQCPYLLVTGVSGAGKSTSVHIVAGICGDKASEPIWVPQIDRFRQSLMDAARSSGFILVNEVFKYADMTRLSPIQALNPMLSLTEDSRSHVMYVGSVPFGRLPVFVMTDIEVPREVEQDIQLARRFTFYRLNSKNEWSNTFVKKRIQPHEFRMISYEHNLAADTVLSEVIDQFFTEPMSLAEIAASLNITTLQTYTEDIDQKDNQLNEFYHAVITAPPVSGADATRYKPEAGWKRIDRINENRLNELWGDFCDGQMPDQWIKSRKIASMDWSKILRLPFPIMCETRPYRESIVYVRFRSCEASKLPGWINGRGEPRKKEK